MMRRLLQKILLATLFILPVCSKADILFSVSPDISQQLERGTLEKVALRLTQLLEEPVHFKAVKNFAEYGIAIRSDRFHIVIDGPHYISWRMAHHAHKPLVRMAGYHRYFTVSRADENTKSYRDISVKSVCVNSNNDLSALSLLSDFRGVVSPALMPQGEEMAKVYQGLIAGNCEAAVLSARFYQKQLTTEQRQQLKLLHRSKPYPKKGMSISSTLSLEQQEKIKKLLLKGDETLTPLLEKFARKGATAFIASNASEYLGHHKLLEGVIWGW